MWDNDSERQQTGPRSERFDIYQNARAPDTQKLPRRNPLDPRYGSSFTYLFSINPERTASERCVLLS